MGSFLDWVDVCFNRQNRLEKTPVVSGQKRPQAARERTGLKRRNNLHGFSERLHQGGGHQAVGGARDMHDGACGQGWGERCHLSYDPFFTPMLDDQQINQATNDLCAGQIGRVNLEQQGVVNLKKRATFCRQNGIDKANEGMAVVAYVFRSLGQSEVGLETINPGESHSGHLGRSRNPMAIQQFRELFTRHVSDHSISNAIRQRVRPVINGLV